MEERDDAARLYAWSGSYPYDDQPSEPDETPREEPEEEEEEEDTPDPPTEEIVPRQGRGLACGRFMPPHAGHEHYIHFARSFASELTVLLFSYPGDPISGELRRSWLEEMFPRADVVHVENVEPPPRDARDFWERWASILRRSVKGPVDWFFTGDIRARRIAAHLGATHVLVDAAREAVPISSTRIRERPLAHFAHLPACVRPHYVRRVSVLGPESTGKTMLTKRLAAHYGTVHVPEYARAFAEAERRPFRATEVSTLGRAQLALEESLARQANRVLFRDTDLRSVRLWSERLFDRCPRWIVEETKNVRDDLTLVTAADVPFVGSAALDQPVMRTAFFRRCVEEARKANGRVVELSGTWEERFNRATSAVDELLEA